MPANDHFRGAALSPREVGAVLNLSLATVYRRIEDGTIPAVKIGGAVRIPSDVVRRLLDTKKVPA